MTTRTVRILPFHNYIPAPELRFYRSETKRLLRRFFRMSMAVGRLPNIMGREVFRSKLTRPRVSGFEDAVILVTDVERCIARLDPFAQQLISRCILQEYPIEDAAPLLGCTWRTVYRRLPDALDQLTEVFLSGGILQHNPKAKAVMEENEATSLDTKQFEDEIVLDPGPAEPCPVSDENS